MFESVAPVVGDVIALRERRLGEMEENGEEGFGDVEDLVHGWKRWWWRTDQNSE